MSKKLLELKSDATKVGYVNGKTIVALIDQILKMREVLEFYKSTRRISKVLQDLDKSLEEL